MNVELHTFAKPLLVCDLDHMETARIPDCIAGLVKDRLGAPYQTSETMSRWSAMFMVPTVVGVVQVPFEMVCCTRGSSLRCHWSHVAILSQIIGAMVPEIVVEVIPTPAAVVRAHA